MPAKPLSVRGTHAEPADERTPDAIGEIAGLALWETGGAVTRFAMRHRGDMSGSQSRWNATY